VLASVGTVGDAYDNALAESFVDSFKTELIADRVWRTRSQLELAVVEYVASSSSRAGRRDPRLRGCVQASRSRPIRAQLRLDGLRGVGKTVVLNEADIVAREHGWVSSGVLECNEDDELPLLMARLCHRALRRLSTGRRVGGAVKRALGVLRAFTFAMDEHGAWRFNIDADAVTGVADSGDAEADIVELLAEVGAAAAQHGSGAPFLLDELQFLGGRSLATLAVAMHGVSQQNAPVLLIAAAAADAQERQAVYGTSL
jgi:hypothetical protein